MATSRFVGRWLLASLFGVVIGVVAVIIAMTLITAAGGSEESDLLFAVPLGALVGGGVGLAQQRVLRQRVPGTPWAAASAGGMLAGTVLLFGAIGDDPLGMPEAVEAIAHGAAIGASLGAAQRLALSGRAVNVARWPLVALATWVCAELVGRGAAWATSSDELGLVTIFVVANVLTGVALARLVLVAGPSTAAAR
jgi:hypothetical protein